MDTGPATGVRLQSQDNRTGLTVKGLLILLLLLLLSVPGYAQDARAIRKRADQFYKAGEYTQALPLYRSYIDLRPSDIEVQMTLAACEIEAGLPDQAAGRLQYIERESKRKKPELFRLQARALHLSGRFGDAAEAYKKYLRTTGRKDPMRTAMAAELLRCYSGIQLAGTESLGLADNLGPAVNSAYDDFMPVLSPNNPGRLYFSSKRSGGSDMYMTELEQGAWSSPELFLPALNGPHYEYVAGINTEGSALAFFRGMRPDSGVLYIDTFQLERPGNAPSLLFDLPMVPEQGDTDLFFYDDTTILFSSRRLGGFGGYDLYVTTKSSTGWSAPENLGPGVNSSYDDRSPFLARDGRTLYFSSNRTASSGGYDVFKTIYEVDRLAWSVPVNAGTPLSSPGNDLGLRLTSDGQRAYLYSDRAGGFGGYDIYMIYLREARSEQLLTGASIEFLRSGEAPATAETAQRTEAPVTSTSPTTANKIRLEPFFIRESDQSISPPNRIKLDSLATILNRYPTAQAEIRSHIPGTGNRTFLLFASLQQAESFMNHLSERGVAPERLTIKGLGNQYPIAQDSLDGKPNPSALLLNRRVEIQLYGLPGDVLVEQVTPPVSPVMQAEDNEAFLRKSRGITYRVQFASLRQMYAGDLLENLPDGCIERRGEATASQYTVGLVKRTSEALKLKERVVEAGFPDAFIVAYLDGKRIPKTAITQDLLEKYPDLKNYVRYTN